MRPALLLLVLLLAVPFPARAQHQLVPHDHEARRVVFPDVPGYLTLSTDLHLHTVFSDGNVWPTIRVQEALQDGLDAIALTDHIEYQPHQDDIPHPDRNRSYELAAASTNEEALLVINGSEITRSMPPGHSNAIFIEDANALLVDDPMEAFREAQRQGAFVFWNHPHWTAQAKTGVAQLSDMHRELIAEGLLHGIEVVNEHTYSDEALQIALDNDLTIMGTSDIHGLIDWAYDVPHGGHRPVTLVFAEERTIESLKEALMARRTAVWFNELLIGREEHVVPLIKASLQVTDAAYQGDASVLDLWIENTSDVPYVLRNESAYTLHANADVLTLPPHATTRLQVKTLERSSTVTVPFEVLNTIIAPGQHPSISFTAEIDE